MNAFPFIEAEKAEHHNVAMACELLEVSRPPSMIGTSTAPRPASSLTKHLPSASR